MNKIFTKMYNVQEELYEIYNLALPYFLTILPTICQIESYIFSHFNNMETSLHVQGCSHWESQGACSLPHTLISEPNMIQQFQFQRQGILLFMGVQKSY